MKKKLLYVGIALSLIGIVFNVLYQFPQETVTSHGKYVDWRSRVSILHYEGQDYHMSDDLYVQAYLGDTISITVEETRYSYGCKSTTVFIISSLDGAPISTCLLDYMHREADGSMRITANVGYQSVPASLGGYNIELGVVPTEASMTSEGLIDANAFGQYYIDVTVRSESVNQNYWILSMLFLLSGLTVTIGGVALKPKNSKSTSSQ